MEELTKDNPKYLEVDIKIIDEEVVPSKKIIKNVYEKALENNISG